MIYILTAPFAPALGFLVDKFGCNVYWMIAAVATTLGSHVLLTFTSINPWVPVVSFMSDGLRHIRTLGTRMFLDIWHVFGCSYKNILRIFI